MSALELDTRACGDCLDWMQQWDDQCVELIYLDGKLLAQGTADSISRSLDGLFHIVRRAAAMVFQTGWPLQEGMNERSVELSAGWQDGTLRS